MATRPRGNKFRVGFRPDINVVMRGEAELMGTKKAKTPIQRAREELSKSFDTFNNYKNIGENEDKTKKRKTLFEVSDILKREYIGEALLIDTVTTMNMLTLAGAFLYLKEHPRPTPDEFTDEDLDKFFRVLMADFVEPRRGARRPSLEEQEEVRYRYKQTLLRYILKVLNFRAKGIRPIITETPEEPLVVGGDRDEEVEEDDE